MTIDVEIIYLSGDLYDTIKLPSLTILYSELCLKLSNMCSYIGRVYNIIDNTIILFPQNIMISDDEIITINKTLNIVFIDQNDDDNLLSYTMQQYQTPRKIIHFTINMLNINSSDLCYDPTSSFIIGFALKYKNNINFIKNNIYGCYCSENIKSNIVEYGLSSCLSNVQSSFPITKQNHTICKNKYDIIATNTYGILNQDNNIEIPDDFLIDCYEQTLMLLQHSYFSLKPGGKCAIVVPRTLLYNRNISFKECREFLINNCQITNIVDIFPPLETNLLQSIIFFTKGNCTKSIEYGLLNGNEYIINGNSIFPI